MEVMRLARPVEEVIADASTSADLKRRLELAARARAFASRELGLPDNGSYRKYADLKRPHVVWNVFAAPPLALDLRTQCFPVAGCVVYRGFFAQADADAYAATLRAQGLDVFVGGVPAYSTLGWFDDPLLNTFIRHPDLEIARFLFHELAHQVLYVRDDTTFNESFAVAVEEEGLKRWMRQHASAADRERYAAFSERRRAVMRLLLGARGALAAVYAGGGSEAARLAAKEAVLDRLRRDYGTVADRWGLSAPERRAWDDWIMRDLNNAKLGSIAAYTQRVPQFAALIDRERGDMAAFFAAAKALAALPKEERNRRLDTFAPPALED
ncbi:MAG: aminopeptidase [Burkholderiales bacterium]|nr:aminopeptidase [Burkholderiales bacterium]